MQYFFAEDIELEEITLNRDESAHASRVLRKRVGDVIHILNGKGKHLSGVIKKMGNEVVVKPIVLNRDEAKPRHKIRIAISPTKKADRMEWMAEKLTEIGVYEMVFVDTEKGERSRINASRLEKKVLSAMKQSGNLWLPKIRTEAGFTEFLESVNTGTRLMAHCFDTEKRDITSDTFGDTYETTLLIGPEGDFSPKEIEQAVKAGFAPISLGIPRYRTETAAVVGCTLIAHFCVTLKTN